MVGYPESLTDPSYRGQILVITYPLVGNYGVPSREARDKILQDLPAYFESNQIHIAGLIVASYSGEDYSHYLAESSLGSWLKEQGVPAIYGIDTRALTKKIREQGSMLGKMLLEKDEAQTSDKWQDRFESVDWVNPNAKNLVEEGNYFFPGVDRSMLISAKFPSGNPESTPPLRPLPLKRRTARR